MAAEERENHAENAETRVSWRERALAFAVFAAPLLTAVLHSRATSDATHDEAIVRVLGLGFTGAWRALDVFIAFPFLGLPWATRLQGAVVVSAFGSAVAAAVLYRLTRNLLELCAPAAGLKQTWPATWLGPFVAAIATLATVLGMSWQNEATSPGGATWGALLPFIFPLILAEKRVQIARFEMGALACGLAISYEPLLGVGAFEAAVVLVVLTSARPTKRQAVQALAAFAIGVGVPIAFALSRRNVSPFSMQLASPMAGWLGTAQATTHGNLAAFTHTQLGWVALAATCAGAVLAALVPKARALSFALVAMLMPLAFAIFLGAPIGPDRYAAAPLAFVAAANVLGAVGLQAIVRAVARADVPFAQASAAMVVVLELTFAAVALDESSLQAIDRKNKLGSRWDADALETAPSGALLLISDPRVSLHLSADRAAGTLRADITVLSLNHVAGRAMLDALANDPKLGPIVRDVALTGSVSEFSLATLAASRPVLVQYDSKWDKSLTRHLVPAGVLDAFMPEPHGVTDRKKAFDAFLPVRQKLEKEVASPRDVEMTAITASLLRARLDALVAIDEREVLPRAIDDLRAFAPDDPVANRLVLKLVTARVPTATK